MKSERNQTQLDNPNNPEIVHGLNREEKRDKIQALLKNYIGYSTCWSIADEILKITES